MKKNQFGKLTFYFGLLMLTSGVILWVFSSLYALNSFNNDQNVIKINYMYKKKHHELLNVNVMAAALYNPSISFIWQLKPSNL